MVSLYRFPPRNVDHAAIFTYCHEQSSFTPGYAAMTIMSLSLATLGLLLNSPSVIIGAMLISPLMGPILAIGFAFPSHDFTLLSKGGLTLLAGALIAIATATLLVYISPIDDLTAELLARTRPNLFDLLVALFSGLVLGYATVRRNHTAIVGVAIATSLMPPLATVGFGIATQQTWVARGASMLFITNTTAIALGVTLVAIWYGFGRILSKKILFGQSVIITLVGLTLLIPLLKALTTIATEMGVNQVVRKVLRAQVENNLSNLMGDYRVNLLANGSVQVVGVVYVEKIGLELEKMLTQDLEVSLGRKVNLVMKQIPVRDMDVLKEKTSPPPGVTPPSAVANPIKPVPDPNVRFKPTPPKTLPDTGEGTADQRP
ncbi:MAG: DUF389 domain-containing protein [Magnetococcales bacterium]|nr:DUF389 domain-containing protein [Magnetococcales bacterium]